MFAQTRADAGFTASGNDYNVVARRRRVLGELLRRYDWRVATGQDRVRPAVDGRAALSERKTEPHAAGQRFVHAADLRRSVPIRGRAADAASDSMRNTLFAEALNYTDGSRLRVSFEQATESVNGVWTGTVTSTGLSATWQVAPTLSLRAWTMHVTDNGAALRRRAALRRHGADGQRAVADLRHRRRRARRRDLPPRLARRRAVLSRRRRDLRTDRGPACAGMPAPRIGCTEPSSTPDYVFSGYTLRESYDSS